MKNNKYFWSYHTQFFVGEMFQTKVEEQIKTHILCSVNFFPRKSCFLRDNVEKYTRDGEATDGYMTHALFTLGT